MSALDVAGSGRPLRECLGHGVASAELDALRARLGLAPDADEMELARALVRAIAAEQIERVELAAHTRPVERGEDSRVVVEGRASFLTRLTVGPGSEGIDIDALDDLRTLLAVVRAGHLAQRRAAVQRLGELLEHPRQLPSDQVRRAIDTLIHLRKFSIAYELSEVCSKLPGADGRRARSGRREWERLSSEVQRHVLAFWDGAQTEEPLSALPGDQRAQLLVRARDLDDVVIGHVASVVEGSDGVSDPQRRATLIGALRNAGDRRLLPALRAVLLGQESELLIPAARALGRIDDPRVHAVLRAAYERTPTAPQRLVLAASLGIAGDSRGLDYARQVLESGDDVLIPYALEALRELGTSDDVQAVTEVLTSEDREHVMAAVQTLGHIGDGRALLPLRELKLSSIRSAMRAEIEETEAAIRARMELLGEEPAEVESAGPAYDTTKMAAMVRQRDPALVRLRARWTQVLGYLWLAIGARKRAVMRLEAAAALRPGWVTPVLTVAMIHARDRRTAPALAGFRRALQIDRRAVESNPIVVRMLAQSFLRRAETVERDGRADIAYGLLQEALALDLRKAPSGLRFALSERLDALRGRMA